ncbi:MAG: RNA polymerase sigma factor [Spirochaetia bacterium]|jgi:RNA polymerase sigma-70 factor (ECF subfamily)|nr:RNA polymerase sigma factor [Spirochaetia bacterium]
MDIGEGQSYTFKEVYDTVFPALYKVVYHIIRDKTIAEDLCQEAFIRYYNKRIPLPNITESRYWLIRVAKNLAFNYRKRKEREVNAVDKLRQEGRKVQADSQDDLLKEETITVVKRAVDNLPVKYRTVLILKEYGELNYKEISKILHISENNVKIRVYRARVLLEKRLNRGDLHVF